MSRPTLPTSEERRAKMERAGWKLQRITERSEHWLARDGETRLLLRQYGPPLAFGNAHHIGQAVRILGIGKRGG